MANGGSAFFAYLKGMWGRVRGELQKNLVKAILFSAVVWVLHTFIMVYLNQGFSANDSLWSQLINVEGLFVNSMVIWALIGGLVPLIINFFKNGGNLSEKMRQFVQFPSYIISLFRSSGGVFLSALFFAIGGALFVNRYLTGLTGMALGAVLTNSVISFLSNRGSFFIYSVRLIAEDVQMTLLQKRSNLSPQSLSFVMGAFSITMLLTGLLEMIAPWMFIYWRTTMIVMIVLGFVFHFQKRPPQNGNFILILFLSTATLSLLIEAIFPYLIAFADDGGWQEAGGNFKDWIMSQGALQSSLRGLPPAIAATLSHLLANLGSNFVGAGFDPVDIQPTEEELFRKQKQQIEELRKQNREQILAPQEDGSIKPYVFDPKTGVYLSEDGTEYYSPKDVFRMLKDWNRSIPQKLMVSEGKYIEIIQNEDSGDGSWLDAEGNIYRGKDVSENFDLQKKLWWEKLRAEDDARYKRREAEKARIEAEKAEKERLHQAAYRRKLAERYGLAIFEEGRGGPGPHSPDDYIDYTDPKHEKRLRMAIKKDIQAGHMEEALAYRKEAAVNEKAMNISKAVENLSDSGIEWTATATRQKQFIPVYYGAKGFFRNTTENLVNDKSLGESVLYGVQGAVGGALKGAAFNYIDTSLGEQFRCKEYLRHVPTAFTEGVKGGAMKKFLLHNGAIGAKMFVREAGKNLTMNFFADGLGQLRGFSKDDLKELGKNTFNGALSKAADTTFLTFGMDTFASARDTGRMGRMGETIKRLTKIAKKRPSAVFKLNKNYLKLKHGKQSFDDILNELSLNMKTVDVQNIGRDTINMGYAIF